MTPSLYWTQLVNRIMTQKNVNHAGAWLLATQAHPNAATLMSAFGRTHQSVQFFNCKMANLITPAKVDAGNQIAKFANEKARAGMPYGQAFNAACREHPELASAMSGAAKVPVSPASPQDTAIAHLRQSAKFSNTSATIGTAKDAVPVASPQLKAMFRLPANCSQEEFAQAYSANGNAIAPLNPGRCFAGLVDYLQKQKGLDYEAAIASAKSAYPDLWAWVELITKEKI